MSPTWLKIRQIRGIFTILRVESHGFSFLEVKFYLVKFHFQNGEKRGLHSKKKVKFYFFFVFPKYVYRTKKRAKKNGCNTEKSYTFLTLAINPSFNFFDHVEDVDVLCKLCCAGVRDPYRELYMDKKKEYVLCVCVWRVALCIRPHLTVLRATHTSF